MWNAIRSQLQSNLFEPNIVIQLNQTRCKIHSPVNTCVPFCRGFNLISGNPDVRIKFWTGAPLSVCYMPAYKPHLVYHWPSIQIFWNRILLRPNFDWIILILGIDFILLVWLVYTKIYIILQYSSLKFVKIDLIN